MQRPGMTTSVDLGIKHQFKQTNKQVYEYCGSVVYIVLWLKLQVNNLSVMSGRNHRFLGFDQYNRCVMCLA